MKNAIGMRLFFIGVISLAASGVANALSISTGEDLQQVCNEMEQFSECVSYLMLVHRTIKTAARMNGLQPEPIVGSCGPDKGFDTVPLTIALRLAWQDCAAEHPGRLHRQAIEDSAARICNTLAVQTLTESAAAAIHY